MPIVSQGVLRVNLTLEGISLLADWFRVERFVEEVDPEGFYDLEELGHDQSGDAQESGRVLRLHEARASVALMPTRAVLDKPNPGIDDLQLLASLATSAIRYSNTVGQSVSEIETRVDMVHRLDEGNSGEYLVDRLFGFLRLDDFDLRHAESRGYLYFDQGGATWMLALEKRGLDSSNQRIFTGLLRSSRPQGIPRYDDILRSLTEAWNCSVEIAARLNGGE